MTSVPSTSPSSPNASPASFLNFQQATENKINFYCQDPTFKERFKKLSHDIQTNHILNQPAKIIFGMPIAVGFFANFMALYLLLKIYTAAESDRVKFPGSPYAQIRPPAIGAIVDRFEDLVSSAFKICGYEIEPLRNKSSGGGIEWQRISENSAPVDFLNSNHKQQSLADVDEIEKGLKRSVEMVI